MSKGTKHKKLLLGSAIAGLMVAGPGLSVTANPTAGGKFFQTVQLSSGYRLAQGEEKKPEASPKAKEEKKADKHCGKDGKCGADKHCAGKDAADKHCGAGKCGADKQCGKDKHCGAAKATSTDTSEKKSPSKSCGAGSCG